MILNDLAPPVVGIGSDSAFGGGLDPLGSPMGSPHDDRIKPDLELARQVWCN